MASVYRPRLFEKIRSNTLVSLLLIGAGDRVRTDDILLGKHGLIKHRVSYCAAKYVIYA